MATRKMTASERARFQAAKKRALAEKSASRRTSDIEAAKRRAYARYIRAQETVEREPDKEVEDVPMDVEPEKEEARRCARRKAMMRRRAAMNRRKRAQEEIKDVIEDEVEDEVEDAIEDEKEEARRCARRRAAKMKARRNAMRRRAQDVSDDLKGPDGDSSKITELKSDGVSDDLVVTDEEDGGVQQTPPASVDEAEDKVLAAYDLIEAQIAHNVVKANVRKPALAAKYCKQHTAKEMRFAAEQLSKQGSVGKTAGNVRVAKRSSAMPKAKVSKGSGLEDQCIFG